MTPTVEVLADPSEVATTVAQRLLRALEDAQAAGRDPQMALTGGTIADLIHREVARLAPSSEVDWSRVVVWWGDERFVASDSPDRNARQAREAFLDGVGIPAAQVHEMPSASDATDVAAGAASYGAELRQHGVGEFDVVMLGIGPDGHVASLFPGFAQLAVVDEIAVGVTGSPKPPPERITLTLPALNRAREVWFVAAGSDKAPAVATAIAQSAEVGLAAHRSGTQGAPRGDSGSSEVGEEVDERLPAARVQGRLGTIWFLDRAVAAEIEVS